MWNISNYQELQYLFGVNHVKVRLEKRRAGGGLNGTYCNLQNGHGVHSIRRFRSSMG